MQLKAFTEVHMEVLEVLELKQELVKQQQLVGRAPVTLHIRIRPPARASQLTPCSMLMFSVVLTGSGFDSQAKVYAPSRYGVIPPAVGTTGSRVILPRAEGADRTLTDAGAGRQRRCCR